jgi:hypothetical protein
MGGDGDPVPGSTQGGTGTGAVGVPGGSAPG